MPREPESERKRVKKLEAQSAEADDTVDEEFAAVQRQGAQKKLERAKAESAESAEVEESEEARKARKLERRARRAEALAMAEMAEMSTSEASAKAEKKAKKAKANEQDEELDSGKRSRQKNIAVEVEDHEGNGAKRLKLESGTSAVLGATKFREMHQIIVESGCPPPLESFDAAVPHLGKALVKSLRAQGYTAPTPIQAQAWPIALEGRDMIGVAKTGSGKTCGFLMPPLARIAERGPLPPPGFSPARPSVLVLAPTRELAQQIAAEGAKFAPVVSARVVAVFGGMPKHAQVREVKQGCDILIATPGRLLDLCEGSGTRNGKPSITLGCVSYLVLDEADKMLDMGFEEDIRKVVAMCPETGKPEEGGGATGYLASSMRQTLFFTATWPKTVQGIAASLTSADALQVRIGQGAGGDRLTANANITQVVHVIPESQKKAKLKEVLKELQAGETAIVFTGMKTTCDDLTWELQRSGLNLWCKTIHSGKDQWDRDETLATFRTLTSEGGPKPAVLVATDVAARGLDIPGVALVVIFDFGRSLHSSNNGGVESYVHRIGRTGRAGRPGRAVTLFTSEDRGAEKFAEILRTAKQTVPEALLELGAAEKDERWERNTKKKGYKPPKGKGKGKGKNSNGGAWW
eukprot:CAMPEP_0170616762 /NCGR_PEP_ID=MMETSP0224-20130122/26041_1 /TAXON_ID=285029 /ORGANISM="Togula jolla, Strain CCCM 725" /LENGTH=634 /DNA_ID=CAMNT_0010942577 /DNA_START=31 /DNA_END=1935 /DNA_ORIENTATION=+